MLGEDGDSLCYSPKKPQPSAVSYNLLLGNMVFWLTIAVQLQHSQVQK